MCEALLTRHVADHGYSASVWLMGHTSSDPSVDLAPSIKRSDKVGGVGSAITARCGVAWRGVSLRRGA